MKQTLTHEQSRFFRDQGYYKLRNCYGDTELGALKKFVQDESDAHKGNHDPSNPNRKLYGLYDRNPQLMDRALGNSALVGALTSLLGPNVVLVKNRHNHATINNQLGEPAEGMHRDILQTNRGLITAALYLQDATIENGATRIVPGSHNLPYVGTPQENGGGTWMAEHQEYEGIEDQAVPVPMHAGDVLLFNGALFHGTGHNTSGKPRMSITLGFRSVDELEYSPDASRLVLVSGDYIYRGNDR